MLRPYTSRATRRGDDHVHRALRRGVGSETRRSENLAGHAVRRRVPRRSALAGVSALWVGAGARRTGAKPVPDSVARRSEEHTSELQSLTNLVCRLLLEKKKKT